VVPTPASVRVWLHRAALAVVLILQALPSFFRVTGQVEPLRQMLGGARDILSFGAQWEAGLSHAVVLLAIELVFWAALGLLAVSWSDRRNYSAFGLKS
jgi:hypothetical protein